MGQFLTGVIGRLGRNPAGWDELEEAAKAIRLPSRQEAQAALVAEILSSARAQGIELGSRPEKAAPPRVGRALAWLAVGLVYLAVLVLVRSAT